MPETMAAVDRDTLAHWYANRHLDIDGAVALILHLSKDAPAREIRLLEVDTMASETTPLEPIDFGVDIRGADAHTLNVLDVTPGQWEDIRAGTLALRDGWTLDGSEELGRR